MKIRVLHDSAINKIAAGEVVENTSSVVKELVENSLDAGATDVRIEIKAGGRQLIKIVDNGCGMSQDDALLSLERHATSKIRDAEDICKLSTMGFRGEAIPSIASISKFTLVTCQRHNNDTTPVPEATMITIDGGKVIACRPAARAPGTTVEVKSLFYNVPVRRKFQKSISRDTGEVHKIVSALALGNPGVKFVFISNESPILAVTPKESEEFSVSLHSRISEVLGKEFLSAMRPIHFCEGAIELKGFIGKPSYTRPNRIGQHLFINNRPVTSLAISYAIASGFGTRIAQGRFPAFVIHMTLPGDLIDVNVHPQKREVRIKNEPVIRNIITKGVETALSSRTRWNEASPSLQPSISPEFSSLSSALPPTQETIIPSTPDATEGSFVETHESLIPLLRVIGTFGAYILVDGDDGLFIIEQHRAQFRIIFEDVLKKSDLSSGVQSLLIPETIELSSAESVKLSKNLDILQDFGIDIREFGINTFAVDSVPQNLDASKIRSFIDEILENLDDREELQTKRKRAMALIIAKIATPRTKLLTPEEAQRIVGRLMSCDDPHHCPQGKPTCITMTENDLTKRFS